MIDGLIQGRLLGAPQTRTSKTGREFTAFKLKVQAGEGEAVFVNSVCFNDQLKPAVMALGDGEAVSVAGSIKPTAWMGKDGEPKAGLDIVVESLLTAYAIEKRRKASQPHSQEVWQQRASRDRHRPADEAWRARSPADRGRHNHSGLDDGSDLPI